MPNVSDRPREIGRFHSYFLFSSRTVHVFVMCVHTSMQNQANKATLINVEKAKTLTHALPRNFDKVVTTSARTKASTAKGWYASFDL